MQGCVGTRALITNRVPRRHKLYLAHSSPAQRAGGAIFGHEMGQSVRYSNLLIPELIIFKPIS